MKKTTVVQYDKKYFMNVFGDRFPVVVDKGEGVYLYDNDGQEYLDFGAGIAVNVLGYNHPKITAGLKEQIEKVMHASNLYYYEIQAKASKLLVENSCCDKVFFGNSGAEANEGAIKLARKHFKAQGEDKYEVITMNNSFHGRTLATLAATGQEKYHKPFEPVPEGFKLVGYNDLAAVEAAITDQTAAIMVELVQGEGGVNPIDPDFLNSLRQLCDEQGILLIFDEIQTGIGRTGELFAYQNYDVKPDIFTLAKGLGNGVPVSAFLAKAEIADSFDIGDHGSTFGGNPLACKAVYLTLQAILNDNILADVKQIGSYLEDELNKLAKEHEVIKEVRGLGLMLGIELSVSASDILHEFLDRGIMVLTAGENILRLLPPLIITKRDVDKFMITFKKILAE